MAVTIQDLKHELRIDWSEDDIQLTRKLNSAIQIVERYTNQSLKEKTIKLRSYGKWIEFFGAPILEIRHAEKAEYNDMGVCLYAKHGAEIEIDLGVTDLANIDEAVIRIAVSIYEGEEITEVTLPIDVQLLLNQFRLDSFIS